MTDITQNVHDKPDMSHWKMTTDRVEQMRQLREQGWGWRKLSREFGVCKSQVRRICNYERRRYW